MFDALNLNPRNKEFQKQRAINNVFLKCLSPLILNRNIDNLEILDNSDYKFTKQNSSNGYLIIFVDKETF